MRRIFVLLLSLFLFSLLSEAKAYIGGSGVGSVEGFVYDGLTASRLMGVRVEAISKTPVYTDHLGFFKIKDLPVGVNRLIFHREGYIPQEETFVVYESEKTYLSVFMWPVYYYPPPPRIYKVYPRISYPLRWYYYYPYYYFYYSPYYYYYYCPLCGYPCRRCYRRCRR